MKCGLIGEHLSHSYSKQIHNQLASYGYELYSVPPAQLADFLKGDFHGLNVTIPYKQAVIPFCSTLSDAAQKIGSVNTLLRLADGSLYGDNTDYAGFLSLAARANISFSGKKVLIFGSGGTSLTAAHAARDSGAREVVTVSRRGRVNYENVYRLHADAALLVNTTPVGMFPRNGASLADLSRFPQCTGVLDVVYNPLRTRLVQDALALGLPASGGLPMLVAQAASACALFTGAAVSREKQEGVLSSVLSQTENIVLIGMPGSGKTAVGKAVANRLNRECLDTDAWVEQATGCSIPTLFAARGEAGFRLLEREAVAACGKQSGKVISTGGGVVLSPENMRALSQNGRVYFLDRPLAQLATAGRPLSQNAEAVERLYRDRLPLYESYCDKRIANDRSKQEAALAIEEDFYEAARH